MNTCAHTWIYIGSKRQNIWRCALCDEYRIDDPTQKREWQGLTDEEVRTAYCTISDKEWAIGGMSDAEPFARAIEAKLKVKNGY